jgi:hypothetical protein
MKICFVILLMFCGVARAFDGCDILPQCPNVRVGGNAV